MGVIFTAEAEKRRQAAQQERHAKNPVRKPQWGLLTTHSIVEAIHFAKEAGWKEKKVQVKEYRVGMDDFEYVVEPFEKDCMCPNLLRYEDYDYGGDEDNE